MIESLWFEVNMSLVCSTEHEIPCSLFYLSIDLSQLNLVTRILLMSINKELTRIEVAEARESNKVSTYLSKQTHARKCAKCPGKESPELCQNPDPQSHLSHLNNMVQKTCSREA